MVPAAAVAGAEDRGAGVICGMPLETKVPLAVLLSSARFWSRLRAWWI